VIFLGVDPAAARLDAVALFPDGKYQLYKLTMPKTIVDRCVEGQRWIEGIVKELLLIDVVVVGIEEPLVSTRFGVRAGANGGLPTAKVHGALLAGAKRAGAVEVLPVNNKTWKRTIVGNGNANKPKVNRWVKVHWPKLWAECKGRQDTCDAACIALELKRLHQHRRKIAGTRRRAMLRKGSY
jgi:Holliday junction resolvasome RuvABC endonuclease subunit